MKGRPRLQAVAGRPGRGARPPGAPAPRFLGKAPAVAACASRVSRMVGLERGQSVRPSSSRPRGDLRRRDGLAVSAATTGSPVTATSAAVEGGEHVRRPCHATCPRGAGGSHVGIEHRRKTPTAQASEQVLGEMTPGGQAALSLQCPTATRPQTCFTDRRRPDRSRPMPQGVPSSWRLVA